MPGLRDRYCVVVPDHVGMGLPDKPDDAEDAPPSYDYALQSRVAAENGVETGRHGEN